MKWFSVDAQLDEIFYLGEIFFRKRIFLSFDDKIAVRNSSLNDEKLLANNLAAHVLITKIVTFLINLISFTTK